MKIKDTRFEMLDDESYDPYTMIEYVGIDIKEIDLNIFLELENGEDLVEEYFIPDYEPETIYIPRENYDLYLILIRDKKISDILK
jgi:hypothetical protein